MKMTYGALTCAFAVSEHLAVMSEVPISYDDRTVGYAVRRFFLHCEKLHKECTFQSWKLRVAKGKARKRQHFHYILPAALLELPGRWVRISGIIDAVGVTVDRVRIMNRFAA